MRLPGRWMRPSSFSSTVAITLHGYRSRYVQEVCDARYDGLQDRLRTIDRVDVPTLMVQGAADACDPPERSDGQERYLRPVGRGSCWMALATFHPGKRRKKQRLQSSRIFAARAPSDFPWGILLGAALIYLRVLLCKTSSGIQATLQSTTVRMKIRTEAHEDHEELF
jgi:hypothetical protein